MQNNATRIPHKTPEMAMSSSLSLSQNSVSSQKALTSWSSATTAWTSQKLSQVAIFSSAPPVIEPTVGVSTVCGDAEKISVKLTVLMPMTILFSGINYDRF